uniref:Uncharacterized protein n=1 Tax=Triticum urartu TaxID=4572 RepID=A0A8R7UF32_TRIUA
MLRFVSYETIQDFNTCSVSLCLIET